MEIKIGGKTFKIWYPGLRVIKTVIAVYVCFLVNFFRNGTPFYSAIAAVICMQKDYSDSIEVGKNRMIGTIVGGIYGYFTIVLINHANFEFYSHKHYLLLSLLLIPIIYTDVALKAARAVAISCVVFLSITISHIVDASPMVFAANRTFDTLIGVIVSIIINAIIPAKKAEEDS